MNANRNTTARAGAWLAIIASLSCALALSGCGQKGNLYLSNQKKKVPATQPQPNTQAQPDTQSQPAQSQPDSGAH
jgi:predicted small lipoprotein YifL